MATCDGQTSAAMLDLISSTDRFWLMVRYLCFKCVSVLYSSVGTYVVILPLWMCAGADNTSIEGKHKFLTRRLKVLCFQL